MTAFSDVVQYLHAHPLHSSHSNRQPGRHHPARAARPGGSRPHRRRRHPRNPQAARAILHIHPTTAFHERNRARKTPRLLRLLAEKDIALVSDAGTPTINDPGQELVAAAASAGFEVVALPGASALTAAISVSGIRAREFVYHGYLPSKRAARVKLLSELAAEPRTIVVFETPHRLAAALSDIRDTLGERRVAVCRELTKMHEEVFRGSVSGAIAHFAQPRGEFTLVMEGASDPPVRVTRQDAKQTLALLKERGLSARDAMAEAADATGLSRRELYAIWLSLP